MIAFDMDQNNPVKELVIMVTTLCYKTSRTGLKTA